MALVCLAQLWYLKEDLPSTSVSFPVCKGKGLNQKQQEQETCGTHAAFHSGSRGCQGTLQAREEKPSGHLASADNAPTLEGDATALLPEFSAGTQRD